MKRIKSNRIILEDRIFDGYVYFEGSIIIDVTAKEYPVSEEYDATGYFVSPGFMDIHTHGAMGEDFSDGKAEGMQPMADYYAAHGVTSFLATTMTLKEEALTPAMNVIRDFKVVEKKHLVMPEEIIGIAKCKNPKCVTNHQPIKTKFATVHEGDKISLKCHYCEKISDIKHVF